jgi:hypothetical protein
MSILFSSSIISFPRVNIGERISVVVKTVCYKSEGRGFETR